MGFRDMQVFNIPQVSGTWGAHLQPFPAFKGFEARECLTCHPFFDTKVPGFGGSSEC